MTSEFGESSKSNQSTSELQTPPMPESLTLGTFTFEEISEEEHDFLRDEKTGRLIREAEELLAMYEPKRKAENERPAAQAEVPPNANANATAAAAAATAATAFLDESIMLISDEVPQPIIVGDGDDEEVIFVNETRAPPSAPIAVVDLLEDSYDTIVRRKRRTGYSNPNGQSTSQEKPTASTLEITDNSPQSKMTHMACPICMENLHILRPYSTTCGHMFCESCIRQTVRTSKKCPMCNTKLSAKQIHPVFFPTL